MFYRLRDEYVLRGWEKFTSALVKRPRNFFKPLQPDEFSLLTLCDGEIDFLDLSLSKGQEKALQDFLEQKIVERVTEPTPLQEDQLYRFYPNRFVRSCFWSMTGRCNYRCRHCFMDAPEGALGEISHEEAIALIDQMADCGVLSVDITGGEPLVRKDFWQLVDYLHQHRIDIRTVYSNGWLLTDDVLDAFEARGMKPEISISFDGVGWHDWMRGVEGAEQAALNAFERCAKRGFSVNAEICVHKGNKVTLRETVQKLTNMGVTTLRFGSISQTDLWKKNSCGNDMTEGEYLDAMLDYIPRFFEDGMPVELLIGGVVFLHKDSTEYHVVAERYDGTEDCLDCHLCGAVRSSCYITPEGRLLPCMPMTACKEQEQFARFQDIGLRQGLSDSYYMQFVDKRVKDLLAVNEKCGACPYRLKCGGGCRAAALMQTGDLMGPDPDLCYLWENGYVEKIHQVADAAIAKYCRKEVGEDEN